MNVAMRQGFDGLHDQVRRHIGVSRQRVVAATQQAFECVRQCFFHLQDAGVQLRGVRSLREEDRVQLRLVFVRAQHRQYEAAQNLVARAPRAHRLAQIGLDVGDHAPASEPETRAVIEAVRRCTPAAIVTIHSIGNDRFCNNYDGPGKKLAHVMHASNGYPVSGSIGYPTPGSFGTWAGRELNLPVVTLELPSHRSPKRCWEDNRGALLALADAVR